MPNIVEFTDQVNEDEFEDNEKEFKPFEINEQTLIDLKKTLINAEENTRFPDKTPAFEEYHGLAEKFEEHRDFQTAAYFFKRCISLAKLGSVILYTPRSFDFSY